MGVGTAGSRTVCHPRVLSNRHKIKDLLTLKSVPVPDPIHPPSSLPDLRPLHRFSLRTPVTSSPSPVTPTDLSTLSLLQGSCDREARGPVGRTPGQSGGGRGGRSGKGERAHRSGGTERANREPQPSAHTAKFSREGRAARPGKGLSRLRSPRFARPAGNSLGRGRARRSGRPPPPRPAPAGPAPAAPRRREPLARVRGPRAAPSRPAPPLPSGSGLGRGQTGWPPLGRGPPTTPPLGSRLPALHRLGSPPTLGSRGAGPGRAASGGGEGRGAARRRGAEKSGGEERRRAATRADAGPAAWVGPAPGAEARESRPGPPLAQGRRL